MTAIDQAKSLLKSGDQAGAQKILLAHLKDNPQNIEAIFLLVQTTPSPDKKRMCYTRILAIDPANRAAQAGLKQLDTPIPPPSIPKPIPQKIPKKEVPPPNKKQTSLRTVLIILVPIFGLLCCLGIVAAPKNTSKPTNTPQPVLSNCEKAMKAAAAISDVQDTVEDIDPAIRACPSMAEFKAASSKFPKALDGVDEQEFVTNRCRYNPSLNNTAICRAITAGWPTPTPVPSIGLSRSIIQNNFEKVSFIFEPTTDVKNQPRVMGKPPNGLAIVELIGPEDDLISANVIIFVPKDSPDDVTKGAIYLALMMASTSSDWPDNQKWIADNLSLAIKNGEAMTVHNGRQYTLTFMKELSALSLQVIAAPSQNIIATPYIQPVIPARNQETIMVCCKTCRSGKACGDSCIAADESCDKEPGCACNAK